MADGHSDAELTAGLASLGVQHGDTLYARATLSRLGKVKAPARDTILRALLNSVGARGTLIVPAFTPVGRRWSPDPPRFDRHAKPNCGALANLVLSHPDVVRSEHPTHSFAAVGPRAEELLRGHDASQGAFFPISRLVACNAKMAIIGCGIESPGFSTVHLVQHELGLSQRHFTKYLWSVSIERDGRWQKWYPSEDPGCSLGFDKMYRHYAATENLRVGRVGDAYSFVVEAASAYRTEKEVIGRDPLAVICDRPDCLSCRILRGYYKRAAPLALTRWLAARVRSRVRRTAK